MDLNVEGSSTRIPPGSHICQLYNKVEEIKSVTARLLQVGLANNERCLFAGTPASVSDVEDALEKLGVEVDVVKESKQLITQTDRSSFLMNSRFDPYHLLSTHNTFIAQAHRDNWQGVRISIDMTWLTRDVATPEQILKYEAASDAVFTFQNAPIIALMHYDYSKLPGALVVELLKLHPIAVVGKYIKRNPYYLNSEQYLLKILRANRERANRQPAEINPNPNPNPSAGDGPQRRRA
jgi:MEDS: MEthanogen/methylotroph, DcmR Sensory domain